MAASDPERVSLLVVADWDAGFPLTARPPLPDVEPGEAYVTECEPQRPVVVTDVLVEGFALVQISTGAAASRVAARATIEPRADGRLYRLYRLDPALAACPGESVRLHLCNDTGAPRRQKVVAIVRNPISRTGRPEDAVACPACDRPPGDSCEGPTSHPSRRTLYVERTR